MKENKKEKKLKKDFQILNGLMMDVLKTALNYWTFHDPCYKKYCLQSASWEGVKDLKKKVPQLSEPFHKLAKECVDICAKAKAEMPSLNIHYDQFPVAAESMTLLAKHIDKIVKANPSLKEGIKKDDIVSCNQFVNLEEIVSSL